MSTKGESRAIETLTFATTKCFRRSWFSVFAVTTAHMADVPPECPVKSGSMAPVLHGVNHSGRERYANRSLQAI